MALKKMETRSNPRLVASHEKAWYEHLNFDMVVYVLRRSIFHPFITCLIPLCMRAQYTPYSHPAMIGTMAWAMLVCAYHIAASINYRVAHGQAREVDLEDEIVLITGGAGGLGGLIAAVYGMRGVSVAVLDVKKPQGEEIEGVEYYQCDTSDLAQVQSVKELVEKDLGTPTIIINCAAAPINGQTFFELSADSFKNTINANFIGSYNILKTFLPGLLESENGGTFVTVSSILARFCPANLTDYAASKAALSALHDSIVAELRQGGHTNVKALLVETGQIGTPLFGAVKTPNKFFAPVLETREVAKEIMTYINNGEGGVIRLPTYADWASWYTILPAGLQVFSRWISGIDKAVTSSKLDKKTYPVSRTKREEAAISDDDAVVVEKTD